MTTIQAPAPLQFYCVLDLPLELKGAPIRIVNDDGVVPGLFRAYSEIDFEHITSESPSIQLVNERDWWTAVLMRKYPVWFWWPATHTFTTG